MGKEGGRGIGVWIIVLVLGGLIGSVIGEILGHFIQSEPFFSIFTKGVTPGFELVDHPIDLIIMRLKFGILVKLNLCSVVGIILAGWISRHI